MAVASFNFQASKACDVIRTSEKDIEKLCERSKQLSDPYNYGNIRQNLTTLATSAFPSFAVEVFFFGSRIMGVADDDSDLDIFVDIGGNYHSGISISDHKLQLEKLADVLKTVGSWEVKKVIHETTVPIIVSRYLPMKLDCKFLFCSN